MPAKKAIIIGAGPAGLTAAYELLKRTDIIPIILEKSGEIGGISRTINYKGNRMDMGPHRFFSKSDRVMDWWLKMMPLEEGAGKDVNISYQNKSRSINGETAGPKDPDKRMLVIQRLTRIYFLRKFFAYPIQLGIDTLRALGLIRTIKILISFLWIRLFPRKPEKSLEDFIINKFGKELYLLFFKDYTEKVWGIPPGEISAEWGAQRIKGVSLGKAISEAMKSLRKGKKQDIGQKGTETSLIEQFLYPKYGPGSLWEEVARQVQEMGGKLYLNQDVKAIYTHEGTIHSVMTVNSQTGQTGAWEGDYFFSTMPVQELIAAMGTEVPQKVQEVAAGLQYRDFINVGILLKQLSTEDGKRLELKDNWIYIQERDVKVGRLMIYNNWGDGMIKDPNTTWIGMEYFCNKSDGFWLLTDEMIQNQAILELQNMGLAKAEDVLDITVRRMEKTYPAYFGTYNEFDKIKAYTDQFENLFLVGRNGMHKYNNADHSMLTAMVAVDNIAVGIKSKVNLWEINTDQEYHEEIVKKVPLTPTGNTHDGPKTEIQAPSIPQLLTGDRRNILYLLLTAIVTIAGFPLFKSFYPFADYFHTDSYAYVDAAILNSDINVWPIGYSKFLRVFTTFLHSDWSVTAFQFIFLCGSVLYTMYSFATFFNKKNTLTWVILPYFFLMPLLLYVSNIISSDSIFCSLSLIWFTNLFWLVTLPSAKNLSLNVVLLFVLFTIRYNSIYYPLISGFSILFAPTNWKKKVINIVAPIIFIGVFIIGTKASYKKITGTEQFAGFSGWQVSNNALYMYAHIYQTEQNKIPNEFRDLNNLVTHFFDTVWGANKAPIDNRIGIYYLWDKASPLKTYMNSQRKRSDDSLLQRFKIWAAVGPLYQRYGTFLITNHPYYYAKYFLIPNASKYLLPSLEFMNSYNSGLDSISVNIQRFFDYKKPTISCANPKLQGQLLKPYQILFFILNFYLLILSVIFFSLPKASFTASLQIRMRIFLFTWIVNFVFSILASPVVLRYQFVPLIVGLSFSMLLADNLIKVNARREKFKRMLPANSIQI